MEGHSFVIVQKEPISLPVSGHADPKQRHGNAKNVYIRVFISPSLRAPDSPRSPRQDTSDASIATRSTHVDSFSIIVRT